CSTARPYSSGSASLTASCRTAPRPTYLSISGAGTLPGRKPLIRTCCEISLYALSRFGLSSSNGTSTVSLTRVGVSSSTSVFTGVGLLDRALSRPRRSTRTSFFACELSPASPSAVTPTGPLPGPSASSLSRSVSQRRGRAEHGSAPSRGQVYGVAAPCADIGRPQDRRNPRQRSRTGSDLRDRKPHTRPG